MPSTERPHQVPIAVVGVGALLPGSASAGGFWRTIVAGRDEVGDVPPTHWLIGDYYHPDPAAEDRTYARRGAFLSPVPFPPMAYGVPPNTLPATDTTQLLSLLVAEQVLTDVSGGDLQALDRDRVSVILGTGAMELLYSMSNRMQRPIWRKAMREHGLDESDAQAICDRIADHYVPWQEATFPGLLTNVVAGRIANRFDLHGTNHTSDAACASSLAALSNAVNELALGHSDLAIAGGVDTLNDIVMYMCFSKTPALSPTGDCRPFAEGADGTILGEGLVMLALERLEDAERHGRPIYAVLRGIGSSSDGRSTAIYAPLPAGQARAIRRAYQAAGYSPETVELVEAHGTGTKAGDAAEFTALSGVFAESGRDDGPWCALGSVKSQIGHTKSAAGAAGLLKAVLALHQKVLPPTIKVAKPNPALELDGSSLYLNTEARPWVRAADHPRRASVSSFGFGGSNFHVALEEYVPAPGGPGRVAGRLRAVPTELVLVTADSPQQLADRCAELAAAARVDSPAAADTAATFAATARGSQQRFQAGERLRLAVVAGDADELDTAFDRALQHVRQDPATPFSAPGIHYAAGPAEPGLTAFLFPGQGSQYVGMGGDIAMHLPRVQAVWDRTATLGIGEVPLARVVFPPPVFDNADGAANEALLRRTEWAQPALAVHSLALLAVLDDLGVRADRLAGHSFGELVALHAAGAFDAEALVRMARVRGELMRDAAASPGRMLAVARGRDEVEAILRASGIKDVWVANDNSPTQVVVSGATEAIEELVRELGGQGVPAQPVNAATAFHSPLVAGACGPFSAYLAGVDVARPAIGVYGNADAGVYPHSPDAVRQRLADHLASPVRFVDEIEAMYRDGVRTFIEIGAGSTLTRLVGEILDDRPHLALSLDRPTIPSPPRPRRQPTQPATGADRRAIRRDGMTSLHDALGRLAVHGIQADFAALWAGYAAVEQRPEQLTQPGRKGSTMTTMLLGSNHGRPYPPSGGAAEVPGPDPDRSSAGTAARPASPTATDAPVEPTVAEPSGLLGTVGTATAPAAETSPASSIPPAADAPMPEALRQALDLHAAYQRQTAEAHATFQRLMTESHLAFLQLAEASLGNRPAHLPADVHGGEPAAVHNGNRHAGNGFFAGGHLGNGTSNGNGKAGNRLSDPGSGSDDLTDEFVGDRRVGDGLESGGAVGAGHAVNGHTVNEHTVNGQPGNGRAGSAGVAVSPPAVAPPSPSSASSAPTLLSPSQSPSAEPPVESMPVEAGPADRGELAGVLLNIVAEKTGYPADILDPTMELEADLGIDSIKRVEILAALRAQVPGLPEVDTAALGALRTLEQITDQMHTTAPSSAAPPPRPAGASAADRAKPVNLLEPEPGEPAEPGRPGELAGPNGSLPDGRLTRLVTQAVPARPSGLALPGLSHGRLVVTDDGAGVARHLVKTLVLRGIAAEVVAEVPADAAGVVFLGCLRYAGSALGSVAVHREALRAARSVAARMATEPGVFVTVQDTGGDFGLSGIAGARAWLGGVAALTRTVAKEWPQVSVKAIDVERGQHGPSAVARAIADELLAGGDTPEVGLLADGTRLALRTVEASVEAGSGAAAEVENKIVAREPYDIGPHSMIVATGGARGITAASLLALARRYQPKIVLLGRTRLEVEREDHVAAEPGQLSGISDPTVLRRMVVEQARLAGQRPSPAEITRIVERILAVREIRATVDELERAGSQVRYISIDVRDATAVSAALNDVRLEWGPVTGIVHGAGVLADARVADKTDEAFERVFGTKVLGLEALLHATADDPVTLLCAYSSVSARFGNAGQSDYAMANEVLGQVLSAWQKDHPDCWTRAIAWGPWQGGMVTAAMEHRFLEQGIELIPVARGTEAFLAELTVDGPTQVVLAAGDPVALAGSGEHGSHGHQGSQGSQGSHGDRNDREERRAPSGEVLLTVDAHPQLMDHAIAGRPVLPMALAVEWFAGIAASVLAGSRAGDADGTRPPAVVLRDVAVLRKVGLTRLADGGERLVVRTQATEARGDTATYSARLERADGAAHYRAILASTPARSAPVGWEIPPGLGRLGRSRVYDGNVLFHGPLFQAIRIVQGVGAAGAAATLVGIRELGWDGDVWWTDPAAVDGALQLAVLWSEQVCGTASLPTTIAELRLHRSGPAAGEIRCVIRAREVARDTACCDAALIDADGMVRAELIGVTLVRRPAGSPS